MILLDILIKLFMIASAIIVIILAIKEEKSSGKINWKEVFEYVYDDE